MTLSYTLIGSAVTLGAASGYLCAQEGLWSTLPSTGPIGVALIATVVLFLRHIKGMNKDLGRALRANTAAVMALLANTPGGHQQLAKLAKRGVVPDSDDGEDNE